MENKIIKLSGQLESAPNTQPFGAIKITNKVTTDDIELLIGYIHTAIDTWNQKYSIFNCPIISVEYSRIIPKSLRIKELFKSNDTKVLNKAIVGSNYNGNKHVIVYRLPVISLQSGIERLEKLKSLLATSFNSCVEPSTLALINEKQKKMTAIIKTSEQIEKEEKRNAYIKIITHAGFSTSVFSKLLQEICNVDKVYIKDQIHDRIDPEQLVSFYDTKMDDATLFNILNLKRVSKIGSSSDGYSYLINEEDFRRICNEYPFLVSMSCSNLADINPEDIASNLEKPDFLLPLPNNEPIIGVIDTNFDNSVTFSKWVSAKNIIEYDTTSDAHGTAVSSLIVEGHLLNRELNDDCGFFRVRHFGFPSNPHISPFLLYTKIREIVTTNLDIKVWNLSLGTIQSVDNNTISPIASLLDELQYEYDVVFVIAGTNNFSGIEKYKMVGSPADSVNSVVVNSSTRNGKPQDYSRGGKVLSCFQRPDISTFGGSSKDMIKVEVAKGITTVFGSSFAAPFISRKLCYLICKLNMPREVAKALLIDSAAQWNVNYNTSDSLGYGVVPTKIGDILKSPKDEIKFFISDSVKAYNTYAYNIPVPILDDKFPFLAKATFCYFPKCSRKQGIDYTNTELDLHFGRLNKKGGINSINNNRQDKDNSNEIEAHKPYMYEAEAKKNFAKWVNTKFISEGEKIRPRAKRVFNVSNADNKPVLSPMWGFLIKTKERLDDKSGRNLKFGLVITLKSIDKKSRYDEFKKMVRTLTTWNIEEIDIDVMEEIYQKSNEDVYLE